MNSVGWSLVLSGSICMSSGSFFQTLVLPAVRNILSIFNPPHPPCTLHSMSFTSGKETTPTLSLLLHAITLCTLPLPPLLLPQHIHLIGSFNVSVPHPKCKLCKAVRDLFLNPAEPTLVPRTSRYREMFSNDNGDLCELSNLSI